MVRTLVPLCAPGQKPAYTAVLDLAHPLAVGLVGCWPFLERGGTTVRDLTAAAAQGALTNAPTWDIQTTPTLNFVVGSDQYVNVGNPTKLQITGAITIATHYRLRTAPSSGAEYMLVAKDKDSGGRAYTLDVAGTAAWGARFYINGGSGDHVTNTAIEGITPAGGDDKAVVGVYDPSIPQVRVYVNGALMNTSSSADASIPAATSNVLFGRREYSGFTESLDGWLRYVYIWNRVLTADDITLLYQAPYAMLVAPLGQQYFFVPPAAVVATTKERRTLSPIGTRVGSRQAS